MKRSVLLVILSAMLVVSSVVTALGAEFTSEAAEVQNEEMVMEDTGAEEPLFFPNEEELPFSEELPETVKDEAFSAEEEVPVLEEPEEVEAGAASVYSTTADKCRKEYQRILSNWRLVENYIETDYLKMYFGSGYGFDQYFLYDLDGNGLPELFLHSTRMGLTAVFTYDSGLRGAGYLSLYGINKKKHELVVQGHWHGAGGSGDKEWGIHYLGKKSSSSRAYTLKQKYYIDNLGGRITIGTNDSYNQGTMEEYNKIYNEHVKGATLLNRFKQYRLWDSTGLEKELPKLSEPVMKSVVTAQASCTLKWSAASNADGYCVYRKINSGSWKKIKTTRYTSFKDSDVKVGYTYTYTVKAYKKVNDNTNTIYSTFDQKGKSGKLTTILKVTSPKAGSALLTWKKTTGAGGYCVYRAESKDGKYSRIKNIVGRDILKCTNSGLKKGRTYYYKVIPYRVINNKKVFGKSSEAGKINI